jgi:hypothetical protein
LGVLNRTFLVEMAIFMISLKPARALARLGSPIPVGKSRFGVPVFPFSPGEVTRLFSPLFLPRRAVGVSVFVPSTDLGRRLLPHYRFLSLLEAFDGAFAGLPFFRYLGDYFLMELQRR